MNWARRLDWESLLANAVTLDRVGPPGQGEAEGQGEPLVIRSAALGGKPW